MLFELIAAIVAGVALAGIAMGLRWISRDHLPTWIVPAAAGIGMLSYAIWSEYTWFSRATHAMTPAVVVTWQNETQSIWRPWSFLRPVINRFTAVDTTSTRRHPNHPDQVMVDVVLAARWQSPVRVRVAFDCQANRRVDLIGPNVSVAEDGSIVGADWIDVPADDRMLGVACAQK